MVSDLEYDLKEAGNRLKNKHDEEAIRDTITALEESEDENATETAGLLRHITGMKK